MKNERIPVLVITSDSGERAALEAMLEGTRWELLSAESCELGLDVFKTTRVPVVLFDRELNGGDWRAVLRLLDGSGHLACWILNSPVADGYLWQEVIRHGGFDVLAKPLEKQQVLLTLEFAYGHWKMRWSHEHGLNSLRSARQRL